MRTRYGVTASARVSAGRLMATGWSQARPPGGRSVTAGRQWKPGVAQRTTRATPTTNSASPPNTRGAPGGAWVAATTTSGTRTRTSRPWRIRRGMNRRMPPVRAGPPAGPGRSSMAGPARGSTWSVALGGEVDAPIPMSKGVKVQRGLAPIVEATNLRGVGVDQVVEHRDDVATLVVLELLHLVDDVGPL